MKIAYLSSSEIPSRSANSIHVMKMCEAFVKNGHEVVLFVRECRERVDDEYHYYGVQRCFDIQKQSWPSLRGVGGWFYAWQVKKKMMRYPLPDIFYGRDVYSLLLMASTGRPFIYETHIPPPNRIRKYLEARLLRLKNLKRLVVISDALRREYLRIFSWMSQDRVLVAHDGANLPEPMRPVGDDFVSPGQNKCLRVGYVGHLYRGKGMEVIAQLAVRLPNFDFHVVGGTGKNIKRWKTLAKAKNIYFHGFIPHGLLDKYYDLFDVVLAPYQMEVGVYRGPANIGEWMSPLKIFEYMAHAKAIVASDLPVLKEVLRHEVNSLLCPPHDIEAWQNALLNLANNPSLKRTLGLTAHHEFITRYTWKNRADIVLA